MSFQHLGYGYYRTNHLIVWDIGFKGNHLQEVVPAGFVFNVSIPWWLGWLFNRHNSRYFKGAAVHDYLLEKGYDRVTAAGAFNDGLYSEEVNWLTRLAMTTAVMIWRFK